MLIRKWKKKAIEFSRVERIEEELLRQVPACCELDESSNAESRIFPAPADANEQGLLQDWNEFGRPERRRISARPGFAIRPHRSGPDLSRSVGLAKSEPHYRPCARSIG